MLATHIVVRLETRFEVGAGDDLFWAVGAKVHGGGIGGLGEGGRGRAGRARGGVSSVGDGEGAERAGAGHGWRRAAVGR